MTTAVLLAVGALILGFGAIAQLLSGERVSTGSDPSDARARTPSPWSLLATADGRLGLSARLARAGLADRISPQALLAAKLGGALAGLLWAMVVAPAAPGRLAWI